MPVLGVVVLVIALVMLLALLVLFGWNVGVVGIAAACGAKVTGISYGTALGASVALMVLKPFNYSKSQ